MKNDKIVRDIVLFLKELDIPKDTDVRWFIISQIERAFISVENH